MEAFLYLYTYKRTGMRNLLTDLSNHNKKEKHYAKKIL